MARFLPLKIKATQIKLISAIKGAHRIARINDKGFISVGVIVLILVLALVSMEMADRSAHGLKTTAMRKEGIQQELGCQAALQYGLWKLSTNFSFRTDHTQWPDDGNGYAGNTYTLTVENCDIDGYKDAVLIKAQASGSARESVMGVRMAVNSLFIADTGNNRIMELILDSGILTLVAGTGSAGWSGDDGPAVDASLKEPRGIAVNKKGEIFIADTGNHIIRKVDTCGIITTYAGLGGSNFAVDNVQATATYFNHPMGLAVDSAGNLHIADTYNNRIRKVDIITGKITTVAGSSSEGDGGDGGPANQAQLKDPQSLAFDTAGNYFIADTSNYRIRRVDAVSEEITTYAGMSSSGSTGNNGPALSAMLSGPKGVALWPESYLFITDVYAHNVRQINLEKIISQPAGVTFQSGYNGDGIFATSAKLDSPGSIAVYGVNSFFIADTNNHRVRRVANEIIETVAGTGDQGFNTADRLGTKVKLDKPEALALGAPSLEIVKELCR